MILLSSSDQKLELGKQLGAHHLINYQNKPDWAQDIMALTDGQGANHIVEVVGGSHINKSIDAAAFESTISLIGLIGGLSGEINTNDLVGKQINIQGIEVGSKKMFKNMNDALTEKTIHPVIDKVYNFKHARQALSYLKEGRHFGKIVIKLY